MSNDKIFDDFINKRLSLEEEEAFDKRLRSEPKLLGEFRLHLAIEKIATEILNNTIESGKREEQLAEKRKIRIKWLIAGGVLLLILISIVSYFLFLKQQEQIQNPLQIDHQMQQQTPVIDTTNISLDKGVWTYYDGPELTGSYIFTINWDWTTNSDTTVKMPTSQSDRSINRKLKIDALRAYEDTKVFPSITIAVLLNQNGFSPKEISNYLPSNFTKENFPNRFDYVQWAELLRAKIPSISAEQIEKTIQKYDLEAFEDNAGGFIEYFKLKDWQLPKPEDLDILTQKRKELGETIDKILKKGCPPSDKSGLSTIEGCSQLRIKQDEITAEIEFLQLLKKHFLD